MSSRLRALLLFLIFLNGYASLSMELIALRQISYFVGSSAVITSIVIGVFLGFMSWGYLLGATSIRIKANLRKVLFASFVVIAVFVVLSGSFPLIVDYFDTMFRNGINSSIVQTFIYSMAFLSAAPFLFGLNTALLSNLLQRSNYRYTGRIMAVDTIGSVLGSLATTLLMMPVVGVNYTMILVAGLSLLGACIARPRPAWLWILAAAAIMIPAWLVNSDRALFNKYKIVANNAASTISVIEADFGKSKMLFQNANASSKYSKNPDLFAPYVKYVNDNFIYTMPKDAVREILILGAGGFTMGDADELHNYTFVDIDKDLLKIAEKHFLGKKLSYNKKFVVQDANQFLKYNDKSYDLIILDAYQDYLSVPMDLITAEFMQRMESRLKPGGIIVMNIISSPGFDDEFTRNFDNTAHAAFGGNVSRQVIGNFNPWRGHKFANIIYAFYKRPNSGKIYTINQNSALYDK